MSVQVTSGHKSLARIVLAQHGPGGLTLEAAGPSDLTIKVNAKEAAYVARLLAEDKSPRYRLTLERIEE